MRVRRTTRGLAGTILHARGTLADGRVVELLEFKVPYTLLFGVLYEGA